MRRARRERAQPGADLGVAVAGVRQHGLAVQPDRRTPVRRTDAQPHLRAGEILRDGEGAPVPDRAAIAGEGAAENLLGRQLLLAPRGERLVAERHPDGLPERVAGVEPPLPLPHVAGIEVERPGAVQRQPVAAGERPPVGVGARVLRASRIGVTGQLECDRTADGSGRESVSLLGGDHQGGALGHTGQDEGTVPAGRGEAGGPRGVHARPFDRRATAGVHHPAADLGRRLLDGGRRLGSGVRRF